MRRREGRVDGGRSKVRRGRGNARARQGGASSDWLGILPTLASSGARAATKERRHAHKRRGGSRVDTSAVGRTVDRPRETARRRRPLGTRKNSRARRCLRDASSRAREHRPRSAGRRGAAADARTLNDDVLAADGERRFCGAETSLPSVALSLLCLAAIRKRRRASRLGRNRFALFLRPRRLARHLRRGDEHVGPQARLALSKRKRRCRRLFRRRRPLCP